MNALEKMKSARRELSARLENLSAERERIEEAMRNARAEIASIDSAFETIQRFAEEEEDIDLGPELGEISRAAPGPFSPAMTRAKSEAPPESCEQAIRLLLPQFPGSKVGRLVALAKDIYGEEYNQKTAGNCLWRMKNAGDAYRVGQKWYPKESTSPEETDEVLS